MTMPGPIDTFPETIAEDSAASSRPRNALWDMAAERAVLSAILRAATVPPAVSGILTRAHFYAEPCAVLYAAAAQLTAQGAPVDPITLRATLDGALDRIGGMELIATLIDEVPTDAHVEAHAQLIVRCARRRQLQTEAQRLAQAATDPAIALETLAETAIRTGALGQALAAAVLPGTMQLYSLAELLADPAALQPPQAVMPRLGYRGRVSMIVGREKTAGKSTLVGAGAAAVTRGGDFLGEACPMGPVLWVTADQEHRNDVAWRMTRFRADQARFSALWPIGGLGEVLAAVDQVRPLVLVVDTLSNFAQVQDPHSSAEWGPVLMPFVRLARERELAVLILHHAKKGEDGGYRDSTAIGAIVDYLLELQPDKGNTARRDVKFLGRRPEPNFTVELLGDHYHLVAAGELSLDARLLVYLEGHPGCSGQSLRNHAGGRARDVDEALGRLLARGAVRDAGTEHRHAYEATGQAPALGLDLDEGGDRVPF
jgi:DnaB-like helicase N terminal domain/AAA domain